MSDAPEVLGLDRYTVLANPQRTLNQPEVEGVGELRRVGCFMVVDEQRRIVAFRDDAAPDLAEEFVLFTDGERAREILRLSPERSGAWSVRAGEQLIGRLVPRARPLQGRLWLVEDPGGVQLARLDDTSLGSRLRRSLRRSGYRESWRLTPTGGGPPAFLLRDRASNAYVLRVVAQQGFALDRRLLLGCAVAVPTLEGLTDFLRPDFRRFEG